MTRSHFLAAAMWVMCLAAGSAGTAVAGSHANAPPSVSVSEGASATSFSTAVGDTPAAPPALSLLVESALVSQLDSQSAASGAAPAATRSGLGSDRARILLRSLTVPGWGQATLGRRKAALAFLVAETGVWASFTAFRIQETLRRGSYERSARLFAGIDLDGRDEEFRRIVGSFLSSEEYNQLVVYRDAATLHYDDPVAYRQYIAENELGPEDAWAWNSVDNLLRYRAQRKDAQRAALRANTALAVAVANRLVSAVFAARAAGRGVSRTQSWNLEVTPGARDDATVRLAVRTRF